MHRYYGVDILDAFRGIITWRKLSNLIDHLPSGSAYWVARIQDDELADQVMQMQTLEDRVRASSRARRVSLDGLSTEAELLLEIANRLGYLAAQWSSNGPPLDQIRTESTAFQRADQRRQWTQHSVLVDEVREAQQRWEQEHSK